MQTEENKLPTDPRFINMTGMMFGRWTVIDYAGRAKNTKIMWKCQCECGSIKTIEGSQLRGGVSTSCGCSKRAHNIGDRYGLLVVLKHEGTYLDGKQSKYLCQCDCGNTKVVWRTSLVNGTDSCGCLTKDKLHMRHLTHGQSHMRVYKVWAAMKDRCLNRNNTHYAEYGGRGISVCQRWLHSYENFIEDMGDRQPGMTIERLNNSLGYDPTNCVWATRKQQQNNRRACRMITVGGVQKTLMQWCEMAGIGYTTVRGRLLRGWSPEDALFVSASNKNRRISGSVIQ